MPNLSHQLFQIENEHGQTNTNLIGLHVHDMTQMSIGYSISMTNGDTHCPIWFACWWKYSGEMEILILISTSRGLTLVQNLSAHHEGSCRACPSSGSHRQLIVDRPWRQLCGLLLGQHKTPHSLAGLPGHINKGCIENMSSAYVNNHFNHVQPFNVYMILCDPNPFISLLWPGAATCRLTLIPILAEHWQVGRIERQYDAKHEGLNRHIEIEIMWMGGLPLLWYMSDKAL